MAQCCGRGWPCVVALCMTMGGPVFVDMCGPACGRGWPCHVAICGWPHVVAVWEALYCGHVCVQTCVALCCGHVLWPHVVINNYSHYSINRIISLKFICGNH